jgi:peptidoglycan hydrolase-like protein with peptidoglycan-binding domain
MVSQGDKIPDVSPSSVERVLLLSHPNQEGEDVRKVQQALVNVGIGVTVDGFFGPATDLAVGSFRA